MAFQVPTIGLKQHNVGMHSAAQTLSTALCVCAMDYRIFGCNLNSLYCACACACSFTRTVISGTTNWHVLMNKYVVTHHMAVVASECHNSQKNKP